MMSAPAVLCLKCHNVEPRVQLLGSAPNQRLVMIIHHLRLRRLPYGQCFAH